MGGTLLVSGLQLGWLQGEEGREVALALLAFVAPLQLVACVLGFLASDVVAATGDGDHGGTSRATWRASTLRRGSTRR